MPENKLQIDLNTVLSSDGWLVIKKKFDDKLAELNRLDNIDKTLSSEQKLIEIDGRQKAIKIIEDILQEIKLLARLSNIKKQELI